MPKSKRAKAKTKDFQKVKLKVGKSLPKGLNETTVNFKSQSIAIKQQLRTHSEDGGEALTKKKQNLQDLMAQCGHYGTAIRHDALSGMRELFAASPATLHSNLASIIEKISSLILDKELSVRQNTIKLLKLISSLVSEQQMSAFFPLLSAYLSCAMTHIQEDIQISSLDVLDLCLYRYPSLIVTNSGQILENFLKQISRKNSAVNKNTTDNRSLLVRPNSKISSQAWRIKVMERLYSCLRAVVKEQDAKTTGHTKQSFCMEYICTDRVTPQECGIYGSAETDYLGYKLSAPSNFLDSSPGGALSSPANFQSFVSVMIPLLVDCWMEVGPASSGLVASSLDEDAMAILLNVLKVLELLLECVEKRSSSSQDCDLKWVKDQYLNSFVQKFMPGFPYSKHDKAKKKGDNKDKQLSPLLTNLMLCQCMAYFMDPDDEDLESQAWVEKVITFLQNCISQPRTTAETTGVALKIAKKILKLPLDDDLACDIISKLCRMNKQKHPGSTQTLDVTTFLASLACDHKSELRESPALIEWLKDLPKLFIESVEEATMALTILGILNKACSQAQGDVLAVLENEMSAMIDAVCKCPSEEILERKVIELICYLPFVSKHLFLSLASLICTQSMKQRNVGYLLEILSARCCTLGESCMDATDYISFLLSILIGFEQPQLECLSGEERCLITMPNTHNRWTYHQYVVKVTMQSLASLPEVFAIEKCLIAWTQSFLMKYSCLPVEAAFSILQTVLFVKEKSAILSDWSLELSDLLWVCIDHTISERNQSEINDQSDCLQLHSCLEDGLRICVRILEGDSHFCEQILQKMLRLSRVENPDIEKIINISLVLLKQKSLKRIFKKMHSKKTFEMITSKVKEEDKNQIWFGEMKYELSLWH